MASSETNVPNVLAYRGRYLLQKYNDLHKDFPHPELQRLTTVVQERDASDLPVCIVGTGAAGLYAAMIFESLGIKYQLVEANKKERLGGRLFTYKFPGGGDYDYFDIGAMRFRDTTFMKRTFDLLKNRGLGLKLLPYIREMVNPPNTWLYFNGARVNNRDKSVTGDPFNVKGYVKDQNLKTQQAVLNKVAEVIQPFRDLFRPVHGQPPPDIATSMKALFDDTNQFSMRTYMMTIKKMDTQDINWCQTLDNSTGTYDLALTQYVIESLAVNWPTTPLPGPETPPGENENWYCIDGGSEALPRAMFNSLSSGAQKNTLFESSVTAISRESREDQNGDIVEVMKISINEVQRQEEYSAVISTVTLPCLGLIDLSGANIHQNYAQWSAIRALSWGVALKIALRFTDAWWEELPQPIHGGQSYTDLTLGTVVYPSYPEKPTKETRSKVLIASYVRLQDCERLTALINPDGSAKPKLLDVIFRDLAAIHGVEVNYIKKYYQGRKEDFFAWDWTQDPLAMGYAFFSPGVYGDGDIYSALLEPAAGGRLFLAGEAASAAHAWVVGSLDSAWRGVDQYLTLHRPELRKTFHAKWGASEYWDERSDKRLVKSYHDLMERHLTIALQKNGIEPKPE